MKSIVSPNGAVQVNNRNRSAFRVWYFRDSRNFNYGILTPVDLRHQYGISGGESQTSFFAFRTE